MYEMLSNVISCGIMWFYLQFWQDFAVYVFIKTSILSISIDAGFVFTGFSFREICRPEGELERFTNKVRTFWYKTYPK